MSKIYGKNIRCNVINIFTQEEFNISDPNVQSPFDKNIDFEAALAAAIRIEEMKDQLKKEEAPNVET